MYEIDRDTFINVFTDVFDDIDIIRVFDFIDSWYFSDELICFTNSNEVFIMLCNNDYTACITWYKLTHVGSRLEILTPCGNSINHNDLVGIVKYAFELILDVLEERNEK